jgi:hypothetical protein
MSLPPDEELFLRCAKVDLSREERQEIAVRARAVDPARVLRLAARHGCALPVGHNLLRAGLPAGLAREVSARLLDQSARNLVLFAETRRVAELLEHEGLGVVVWKGLTLNRTLYPSIGLRSSVDIDLLCAPAEAERATRLLVRSGYRFLHRIEGESGFLRHENGHRFSVELHTDVPFFPRPFFQQALAGSRLREIDGARIRCLDETDDFVALAGYVVIQKPPYVLWYLNDFDAMIRRRDLQWPRILGQPWAGMGVYLILYLLRELFGREIQIPQALVPGPWRRRVIGELFCRENVLRPKAPAARLRRYLLFRAGCPHAAGYVAREIWGTLKEALRAAGRPSLTPPSKAGPA